MSYLEDDDDFQPIISEQVKEFLDDLSSDLTKELDSIKGQLNAYLILKSLMSQIQREINGIALASQNHFVKDPMLKDHDFIWESLQKDCLERVFEWINHRLKDL